MIVIASSGGDVGIRQAVQALRDGGSAIDAVEEGIQHVESNAPMPELCEVHCKVHDAIGVLSFIISVSVKPGAIALTLMLNFPNSLAITLEAVIKDDLLEA